MDIRELRLFHHLSETLHFGRSSRACNITASALTRTVQRLEAEVGEQLFIRDNRSVSLTPAGEILKKYAEEAMGRWQELQNQLAGDNLLGGEITLYCSVTAAYSILPGILGIFRQKHPSVHINLQTGDAAQALSKLLNNEVDITIAALPRKQPKGLSCLRMLETPLVFIAPQSFPETIVRKGQEIDWAKTPVIMAEQGLSRDRIERWFSDKKVLPNIYAQVAGNEAIIAMVSLGCGVGVVPQLVIEKSPLQNQIRILDVTPQLTPFSIGICTAKKKMTHPKIQAFWAIATQETEGNGPRLRP
ncbi:MAG: HTH-type transcriptional activator IlvY [Desulfurivibrionaceae bacterium]|nr:HTH-type transcriptional activator IlvY [Desulfurivibrionaceae bacterium]